MRTLSIALIAAILPLSGCLGLFEDDDELAGTGLAPPSALTDVRDRHAMGFEVDTDDYSHTLVDGVFDILPAMGVRVNVQLPPTEGVAAATGSAEVHMGIFLPDIPGCDWEASELPEHCRVPVIADAGPYYSSSAEHSPLLAGAQLEGDTVATEPANRLGGFLIENFVPHGYAVAQVSVFGTGDSGHCMDLLGLSEQLGVAGAVDHLGSQPWSNGNVGLIGRSYDGTTPWEAAAHAPEALKTIVPISGLIGAHELMWHNGSSELRGGTGLLWAIYAAFSPDGNAEDVEAALCPDTLQGPVQSAGAYLTGDHVAPAVNDYWRERYYLPRVLENYEGSVFFIHGLQDWNVDPHMAVPTYHALQDAGFQIKGLFGQWAHNYPDRLWEHEGCDGRSERCQAPTSVRHDWAQELLEWFDHYLKGTGALPPLDVQVQDDQGYWRVAESFPPRNAQPLALTMDAATKLHTGDDVVMPLSGLGLPTGEALRYDFGPLSNTTPTRISGTPTFHVTVTPVGPGGQLFANLVDGEDGRHLGHAIMDLRFADGHSTEMSPVAPGRSIVARMQMEPMDIVLEAGHSLVLEITQTGEDYLPSAISTPVMVDASAESVLTLPIVTPPASAYFLPPGHADELGDGVPDDLQAAS